MNGSWRIPFRTRQPRRREPPPEFLCPISNSLMADPVILPSGHSFERRCIEAALSLPYQHYDLPFLRGTIAGGTLIPNLALKTAIANWCHHSGLLPPAAPDKKTARRLACKQLAAFTSPGKVANVRTPAPDVSSASGMNSRLERSHLTESVSQMYQNIGDAFSETSVQLSLIGSPDSVLTPSNLDSRDVFKSSNRFDSSGSEYNRFDASPPCFTNSAVSVSPSSESDSESEELLKKMRSAILSDQEEAVVWIRKSTRKDREARARLCSRGLLTCLRSLMRSRCPLVQVNAVAALVNLSLEDPNKVMIVRSGLVPTLIDVLKDGHLEAQEHAVGAIFSLALDDRNKTALGVLGAVRPLVHQLGSSHQNQTRLEATMALYHLSLMRGNHVKLIHAGALPKLLLVARGDKPKIASRAMRILCNVATSSVGRAAMLDSSALSSITGLVAESWQWEKNRRQVELIREHGLIVVCLLARDSWRFKGLAREAGVEKMIAEVAERGGSRAKGWAAKLSLVMKSSGAAAVCKQAGSGDSSFLDESVTPSRLHERAISALYSSF